MGIWFEIDMDAIVVSNLPILQKNLQPGRPIFPPPAALPSLGKYQIRGTEALVSPPT